MADYLFAPEVVEDLKGIFDYTIARWGIEQAYRYKGKLTFHFRQIAQGKAQTRAFLKKSPELHVSRCEHHYIFHLIRKNQPPLIIAVLHESMDIISRIRGRLDR